MMSKPDLSFCVHCKTPETEEMTLPIRCEVCNAGYCGLEHKEFDRKKHKQVCFRQRRRLMTDSSSASDLSGSSSVPNSSSSDQSLLLSSSLDSAGHGFGVLHNSRKRSLNDHEERPKFFVPQFSIDVDNGDGGGNNSSPLSLYPDPDLLHPQRPAAEESRHMSKKDHSSNRSYRVRPEEHLTSCTLACPMMTTHQAFCLRVQDMARHVVERLLEFGWAVIDHFLGDNHCSSILQEIQFLYRTRKFEDGQLMKTKGEGSAKEIRSDQIFWFDSKDEAGRDGITIGFLISIIDSLIVQVSSKLNCNRINGRSRAMIACYPGNGTRYVRHVDNPVKDGRILTSIYYVNHEWVPEKGGAIRMYPESAVRPVDIEPLFDRLLLFWSDKRCPHEVLPAHAIRFALTLWYFDADEKARAMARANQQRLPKKNSESSPSLNSLKRQRASVITELASLHRAATADRSGFLSSMSSTSLSSWGSGSSCSSLCSRGASLDGGQPQVSIKVDEPGSTFLAPPQVPALRRTGRSFTNLQGSL